MDVFDEWTYAYREDVYFRGQSNASWRLETPLERHQQSETYFSERQVLEHFSSRIHLFGNINAPLSVVDRLALLRHHGGPTNLLDWTRSPFIAPYFAVAERCENHFAIFCARKPLFATPVFHDPPKTSPLDPEALKISSLVFSVMNGHQFLFTVNGAKQIEVNAEELIVGRAWFPMVIPLEPSLLNSRMHAQQGIFMRCLGFDSLHETFEHMAEPNPRMACKIIINADLRQEIETRLLAMNINASSLFPDLDGLARYATSRQAFDQRWKFVKK